MSDWQYLLILVALSLAVISAFYCSVRWRFGILILFLWLALEDLVRKYVGNALVVYAAKDALTLAVYGGYFIPLFLGRKRSQAFANPIKVPVLLWFFWALIETFNPNIDHFLVPLLGLRMSFFYVPLMYLGYAFIDSEKKLQDFLLLNIGFGALVAFLGIVQSIVGLDFLNPGGYVPYLRLDLTRYAPGTQALVPRPTGTFVDAGRFAQYLYVLFFISLGGLAYFYGLRKSNPPQAKFLPFVWLCLGLISGGLWLSGQRAAILFIVLLSPFFLIANKLKASSKPANFREKTAPLPIVRLVLILSIVFAVGGIIAPNRFRASHDFYQETLSPGEEHFELTRRFESMIWQVEYALDASPLIGHGTGTNSLGRQYIFDYEDMYVAGAYLGGVETGYGVVIWEWGVVGLLLWLWWTSLLIKHSLKAAYSLLGTRFFWLGFCISLYLISILFLWLTLGFQVYQNYVTAAYLWFCSGLVVGLVRFRRRETGFNAQR